MWDVSPAPPSAHKLGIIGQIDVNVDINVEIMLMNGSILLPCLMKWFRWLLQLTLKCQVVHLHQVHSVKAPGSKTLCRYRGSQSQSTGVKKLEEPNADITKHTQMCSFGRNHVQPTAPLLLQKDWKSRNSWPGRCVQNPTNAAAQLPAEAAGQPGRSSIPGLHYRLQSSQQRGQTDPKHSHSLALMFFCWHFFPLSMP